MISVLLAFFALCAVLYFIIRLLTGDVSLDRIIPPAAPEKTIAPITIGNTTPSPTAPPLSRTLTLDPFDGLEQAQIERGLMVAGEDVREFSRETATNFNSGEAYTSLSGIITFGSNNLRDSFTAGVQSFSNRQLELVSSTRIGSLKTADYTWSGACSTGQPLIIYWPDDIRKILGINDEFKNKAGFVEVIYPTADGYVHFLELSTGKQTRKSINIGAVTKGTASLDPRGYPLLYIGQGDISRNSEGRSGAWFRIIDLIKNEIVFEFGQRDPFSFRQMQSYSSSPLLHAQSDTLILPGENGVLYTMKLNTSFDGESVSVEPAAPEKYRYSASGYSEGADKKGERTPGFFSSVSILSSYAFLTDLGGLMQCVNLNTLEPEYVLDLGAGTYSTPVIEEDRANNTFYIYTGSGVSGYGAAEEGSYYIRKINGITGKTIWQNEGEAYYRDGDGGVKGTPHVGRNNLADYVIFNSTYIKLAKDDGSEGTGARIQTFKKSDGELISEYNQASGYWSSPVVFYDGNGDGYLIQCDRSGILRIHDPLELSTVYAQIDLGSRVEATPAVFDNYIVVGTRGDEDSSPEIIILRLS